MDFSLFADDDPRRLEIRAWLKGHPLPSQTELAEAGYVAPGWPPPWGLNATPELQLLISAELERAGVPPIANTIGIGWAGPTLLAAGSEEQKARYLAPLLRGEELWCQLFSEPGSGSDLASLATRAVRDGDEWVVNGQKIWTTWADQADFGILLARTDPTAPKHRGISYFLCPMRHPGVEVRPIREMTGGRHFNEVFLNDVRIPAANLVGPEGGGWALARVTLGNERLSLSTGGVVWGMGPKTSALLERAGQVDDPRLVQRLVSMHIEAEVMRLLGLRIVWALVAGRPGPEAAVKKLLADRHGQVVMNLAKDLAGAAGLINDGSPWHWGFLFSPALTVGGGTAEVLRDLVGESLLGLPRERL